MEIDKWKEKNQDLLVSVEMVKRDPRMAQEINQCRSVKRDAKQIYKQNLKEDRERQALLEEADDIEKKMAKL